MKTKKKYDFREGGIKFRVLEEDYDYCYAKSVKYKFTRAFYEQVMKFKENNEHDYAYCEYDCTGSSRVRIDVKRKGKFMWIYYYYSLDV